MLARRCKVICIPKSRISVSGKWHLLVSQLHVERSCCCRFSDTDTCTCLEVIMYQTQQSPDYKCSVISPWNQPSASTFRPPDKAKKLIIIEIIKYSCNLFLVSRDCNLGSTHVAAAAAFDVFCSACISKTHWEAQMEGTRKMFSRYLEVIGRTWIFRMRFGISQRFQYYSGRLGTRDSLVDDSNRSRRQITVLPRVISDWHFCIYECSQRLLESEGGKCFAAATSWVSNKL